MENRSELPSPMPVRISNRQSVLDVDAARLAALAQVVQGVLSAEGAGKREVSLSLVEDAEIARMNQAWLQHEGPTDVISFLLAEEGDPDPLLGEVVVSAETAAREAAERGIPVFEELARYAVHGTLHLLGYDDRTPEDHAEMHKRQEELLGG